MAHEIESMMYMGDTPWHGLGQKLEEAPTSEQAIKAAGLDWSVRLEALQLVEHLAEWGARKPVPGKATVRSTDGSVLGIVGAGYKPLQNAEAFGFFDPIIKAGEAFYHTAGSLRGGARVWILAKMNRESCPIVGNDVVEKYVLLSNGHDGTLAVRVGFTPIRVVCANTLAMAHSHGASQLMRIRHTGSVAEDLEALREVMNLANQSFEATAEQYRALAKREISTKDLEAYVRLVFNRKKVGDFEGPAAEETPVETEEAKKRERLVPRIIELFETGKGADLPGVRGTLWGAYNAVTEYLSYGRGREADARLNSLWFGEGANINARALSQALRMAADMADTDPEPEAPAHPPAKQPAGTIGEALGEETGDDDDDAPDGADDDAE